MTQAASHLASAEEIVELDKVEAFYRQKGEGRGERGEGGMTPSSSGGWEGSVLQITSLALTRKFQIDWLRPHSWERLILQLG